MAFRTLMMLAAGLLVATGAAAEDNTAAEDRASFIPDGWEATGETKACLITWNIRDTDIVDDYNILFHVNGNKSYINRLNHRCAGLKINEGFMYRTSSSRLCRIDIIEVLPKFGVGGACALGDFVEIREIEDQPASSDHDQ